MTEALNGRSVIVTGAGRGIGAAMAKAMAAAGGRLTIADIDGSTAEAVAAEIRADGGKAIAVEADVTSRAAVQAMIAAAVAAHGRLDVIFNNAGIAQTRPFLAITEEDWRRVMDVNGLGVLIGMQEAVKQFQSQGKDATGFGGRIVNTASIAGKQGYEPLAHYCASKFGVVALTQAAARAFGKDGISANCICPGVVATEMWKVIDKGFKDEGLTGRDGEAFETFSAGILLGRPSAADDLAGVAVFLASPASDYMTGQSLVVDGGMVFV
ncbi:meso-butanediol dehydrogenase/(S,S)-butanediol dehydrogenase/diacetyl reductase [Amaricoccus macauensis]|uniref:Meso-butanediol dehydrogenase/(S,S)-butanediol dehydrogenase/diacetyl reductase n=1 Tax=Amaricoccus macauensis TaxID=57001 RepID=A0A840SLV9_9RHOB|nr:glucose 1-dehydrogenase [Amaricoccus macauensis]MBB5220443.1 meso-butanediol dehydrogenase/(S,S)-butanediol dehydrogenase/diacetyl reductase [Amaricoccus macauensis]